VHKISAVERALHILALVAVAVAFAALTNAFIG
jgi:hypothetical protein